VKKVGPMLATDDPDLSRFMNRGGRLLLWHGWADQLIMQDGTIDYYDAVTKTLGGGYDETRKFARLFMAPGVGHCGGGEGPATAETDGDDRELGRARRSAGHHSCIAIASRRGDADAPALPLPGSGRLDGRRKHGRRAEFCLQAARTVTRTTSRWRPSS